MAFVAGKISEDEQRGLTRERKKTIIMQDSKEDTETPRAGVGGRRGAGCKHFFFFFTVKSSWAVERTKKRKEKSTRLLVSLRQNEGCPRRGIIPEVRSS